MTEAEWLVCLDPELMINFLLKHEEPGSVNRFSRNGRKHRLFCIGCYRHQDSSENFESLEKYLDLQAKAERLEATCGSSQAMWAELGFREGEVEAYRELSGMSFSISADTYTIQKVLADGIRKWTLKCYELVLIEDIFGNPFHPIILDPSWLTSTVVAVAQGIYTDSAFDRLPLLADALMEAGCDSPGLLYHCQSEGQHTRGCWAIDLLLGME